MVCMKASLSCILSHDYRDRSQNTKKVGKSAI